MIKTEIKPEPLIRKGFSYETFRKESMFQVEKEFFHISDIKSACEFWLINKADAVCDQWDLLDMLDECKKLGLDKYDKNWFEEFYKRIKTLCDAGELFDISDEIDEYNDWLFKLAFKDVFGDNQ